MKKNRQPDGSNTPDGRGIGRRDFLANAALVGAGLAIGPSKVTVHGGRMNEMQMEAVDQTK
jgi:hypothetical protein